MKLQCPVEGFEDCYVEFSDKWTRSEIKQFVGKESDEFMDLVKSKITSVYIRYEGGEVVEPQQLTDEAFDSMQWEVFQWFIVLPQVTVKGVLDLGEETRRQSWLSPETKAAEDSLIA